MQLQQYPPSRITECAYDATWYEATCREPLFNDMVKERPPGITVEFAVAMLALPWRSAYLPHEYLERVQFVADQIAKHVARVTASSEDAACSALAKLAISLRVGSS